jgi:hypothetical protein
VQDERRRLRRCFPRNTAFAVLRPHFTKLGKIKDINRDGLAFHYIAHQEQKRDSSDIDIFLSGDRFYLSKIPSEIIYDIKIVEENNVFLDAFETRRCGLKFGELTRDQALQLEFFLKNHTNGTA